MSPGEFSLIAAKPQGWQFLLLARALQREINSATLLRRQWHTGLVNEPAREFDPESYAAHVEGLVAEARRVCSELAACWSRALRYAANPPEEPLAIFETACSIGVQYRALLAWKPACLAAFVPAPLAPLRDEFSRMCDETILRLELIAHGHSDQILAAMIQAPASHQSLELPGLDTSIAARLAARSAEAHSPANTGPA